MANYSTTTALGGKPTLPNQQKVYSPRVSLTSPLLRSSKEIRDVFYKRQKDSVGMRKDPKGKKMILKDPSEAVRMLQIALYLGISYIDFKRERDYTPPLAPLLPRYKKLNKKEFSGILDQETLQAIHDYQTWYMNTRNLLADFEAGRFTLSSLDQDLEEIRYYRWKFDPKIFHIDKVCEDFHQYTVVHRNTSWLYTSPIDEPLYQSKQLNQFVTKVNVLRNISNFSQGWYYVQVFDVALSSKPIFGYLKIEELIPDSELPEPNAIMVPTVQDVTRIYNLIDQYYYTYPGNKNKAGYSLRTAPPILPGLSYLEELEEYNYFKFYVNLIVYSNNPTGVDNSQQNESIYISNLSNQIPVGFPEQLNSFGPRNDDGSEEVLNLSNYSYFLKRCKDHNYYWDYQNDQTVIIRGNSHIWVPSQVFADKLYAMVNGQIDFINDSITEALDVIKSKWKRGYGIEVEGGLAVKFGFPIKVGAGGRMTISRKFTNTENEVVLVVKKSGYLSASFDPSAKESAAYFAGKGRRLNDRRGVYSELKFEAGGEVELSAEYEFELRSVDDLQNDYASVALLTTCASLISVPTDFLAHEILNLIGAYNIDPFNYLTKLKLTPKISVSVGASAGFKLFNTGSPDWSPTSDGVSKTYNPYSMGQILSYLQTSIGVDAEASIEVGAIEYSCVYDRDSFGVFGPETRHPRSFDIAVSISGSVAAASSLTLGPLEYEFMNSELSSDITFRLKYEVNSFIYPEFSKDFLLNDGYPYIELTFGTGSFLGFNEDSRSFSITLNTLNITSISALFDAIEEINFKKRISGKKIKTKYSVETLKKLTNILKLTAVKSFVSDTSYYEAVLSIKRAGGENGDVDEIAPLEAPFTSLMNEVKLYLEDKYNEATNTVMLVVGLPKLALQSSIFDVHKKLYDFMTILFNAFEYESFRFYSEASVGAGASLGISVGIGFTVDLHGSISLVYEKQYMKDRKHVRYNNSYNESDRLIAVLKSAPFKSNFTQIKS